jgi:hypothetical protein
MDETLIRMENPLITGGRGQGQAGIGVAGPEWGQGKVVKALRCDNSVGRWR